MTTVLLLTLAGILMVRTVITDSNLPNPKSTNPAGGTTKQYREVPAGVTEVNDPQTWSSFRISPACFGSNCTLSPPVNFTTETILIVSPGLEGSPGYVFRVDNATTQSDKIVVYTTLTTPGQNCFWAAVVVFPVQVVVVPKTYLPATLVVSPTQAPGCPLIS